MSDVTNPFFDDDDDDECVESPARVSVLEESSEITLVSVAEGILRGDYELDEAVERALEVKIPRYMTAVDGSRYYDGPAENTPPAVLTLLGSELGNRFLVALYSKRTEDY